MPSIEVNPKLFPEAPLRGYAEGYYGRLLSWNERLQILQTLKALHMNVWFYAPKEDPCHRLHWRRRWDADWIKCFSYFCKECRSSAVVVVAGIAPGLDFDFAALALPETGGTAASSMLEIHDADASNASNAGANDYAILLEKARSLLESGADFIGLLMDDIDPDFAQRSGHFQSEGSAHAALANQLGIDLNICVLVVPRIYANELVIEDPSYLPDFADVLDRRHLVSHCGTDVVSREITPEDCSAHLGALKHRVVVWDNFYANDYCPRRLFVGEWTGRGTLVDVVLNPTGMPFTDQILLELMASQTSGLPTPVSVSVPHGAIPDQDNGYNNSSENASGDIRCSATWRSLMDNHGVPIEFDRVAQYCWHPCCNGDPWAPVMPTDVLLEAIERALDKLLWRWKTPLALEWYPYLMGLRQDLVLRSGNLPDLRILKTQTGALASELLDPRP